MPEPSSRTETYRAHTQAPSPIANLAASKKAVLVLCLTVFALGIGAMLMYQPFKQAEGGDDAIWDYVAQCIVRGQVPYRDVIEIKTPAGAYLSALAILVGKAAGLQDVLSIRALNILLVGILCAVTFLTGRAYFQSKTTGLIAVLILLMWEGLSVMMVAGTRPKVPMIIFGLLTLLLVAADNPFWAGVCSMLSCLSWQPGLLFTAAALLVFSRYLTSWRDLRALKLLMGASATLGLALVYFYAAGGLGDLWSWTVTYNYQVYMPEGRETATTCLSQLWYLINQVTGGDTVWVKLGALGFLIYSGERILTGLKSRSLTADPGLFKDSLIIVPLSYLAFKAINYPGSDDLIPLFPFVGLFAGYLFTAISRGIAELRIVRRNPIAIRLSNLIAIVPVPVLVILALLHGKNYHLEPGTTLQDQQAKVQEVANLIGPDDKIYVHGTLELLVLLNRPNMNRYIFFDRGKDRYIGERTPGGFGAIMDAMKAESPKVIAISRIRNVAYRQDLLSWASEEYDPFPVEFAHNSVYVRKPQQ